MSSDRVGGLPPPSEPSRSGSSADSKKFREELQKVQKVKAVDPDEQSRKKNKRFAAMMGDEDVAQDLNASPRKASPFEVSFHSTPKPMVRSAPPPPRNTIDDTSSAVPNTAVPSPAYSQPPSVEAIKPEVDTSSSSMNLPNSNQFWEDVDLPDRTPPSRQNFQETLNSQQQQRNQERPENQPAAKGVKKRKPDVEMPRDEKIISPLGYPDKSEEGVEVKGTQGKKGKELGPIEEEGEEISVYGLPGQKVEGTPFAGPPSKKEGLLEEEEEEDLLTQYDLEEEKLNLAQPSSGKQKKEPLEKEEFSPLGQQHMGKQKKEKPIEKEEFSPLGLSGKEKKGPVEKGEFSPFGTPPLEERSSPGKKGEKKIEEPSPWAPSPPMAKEKKMPELPVSAAFTQEDEFGNVPTAHPNVFKEKKKELEESILPPPNAPAAPAPFFVDKVERKASPKTEGEKEAVQEALSVPIEKSGDREGRGSKGHGFEHLAAQIIQPSLPHLPANIQPMAQSATVQAAPYLTPETMSLFYQMVGTIYVMATTSTGISRTEVVLNAPAFAHSKFFGATITIEKYATAPDSLNIRLTGSNEAVQAFNQNVTSLIAAFQNGNFKFRIGRIDTAYTVDKPVFRRKERGEGKDSGDFEGRKR